jgi:hypothetical protein
MMAIGHYEVNPEEYQKLIEERDLAIERAVKAAKELRIFLFTKPGDISCAVDLIIEIEKAYTNHPFKD